MTTYKVTFKGDFFDVSLEGNSGKEVVREFLRAKEEIESALKSENFPRTAEVLTKRAPKPRVSPQQPQLSVELSIQDLSIPAPIKDAFIERKDDLTNWDTIFLLLHYRPTGLTNKQFRSLSEELGKQIKFSWFDSEFHRRDNEGLVMSKRVPGKREALYFLTEAGKKEAENLVRILQTPPSRLKEDR